MNTSSSAVLFNKPPTQSSVGLFTGGPHIVTILVPALRQGARFYVRIQPTAFVSFSPRYFAGFATTKDWVFNTAGLLHAPTLAVRFGTC